MAKQSTADNKPDELDNGNNVKKYKITFIENRSYELSLIGFEKRFEPRGKENNSAIVNESIINNADFKAVQNLFIIEEL